MAVRDEGTWRAAGVVVYRRGSDGPELLLLRSRKGGHWTPPKGHLDEGESDLEAALRESQEECGLADPDLRLDPEFAHEIRYRVRKKGRAGDKTVCYFLGEAKSDAPVRLSKEHTEHVWLPLAEAQERIGFSSLQEVLRAVGARLDRHGPPRGGG